MADNLKYDAFLSYSHTTGWRLAARIQDALQLIAKPWNKPKALNIFRDETNLSTSPHLWNDIENALKQSRHFILLCTPETTTSPWINKEIEYWVKNKPVKNIHLVWLSGELEMDEVLNKILWEKTTALPAIFKDQFAFIPNFLDLRKYRDVSELSIKLNKEFKADLLKLAAALHNKTVEELDSKHVKEHRKTTFFRRTAVGLISAATIAIFVIGILLAKRNGELVESKNVLLESNLRYDSVNRNLSAANTSLVTANDRIKERDKQILADRDSILAQFKINQRLNDSLFTVTKNLNSQIDFISNVIEQTKKTEVNWDRKNLEEFKLSEFKPKLASLYFEFDKTTISRQDFADLDMIVNFLQENPEMRIEIAGYADNSGPKAYSTNIGSNDARSAAAYLFSKGIDKGRIITKSYGGMGLRELPMQNSDPRIQSLLRSIGRKLDIRLLMFDLRTEPTK